MMQTTLTELFSIRVPVVLAPMGSVAGGALAAAVSQAGGLGLIGGGYGDAQWLGRELDAAGSAGVGVGFITWSLDRNPALLDLALERSPAAILFSFGDFTPYVDRVRAAGARVIAQVQQVGDAVAAARAGADVIVAQGTEAGGHGAPQRSTFALVPAIADAVAPTPVVAAGGIADGRGLAAALMLGAAGAMVGTRFFASDKALGHPALKQAIAAGRGDDTLRTRVFDIVRGYHWPAPYTGRVLGNGFTARWHEDEAGLRDDLARQRPAFWDAYAQGDTDTAVVFCGEAIDLIAEVEPAGRILEQIVRQAQTLLTGGAKP
ncbi:MAG: nitronate monooxygenase [Salinisphaera sp.]|nr:nitronate monooxygenase [Salinisphaera sp.]